MVSLTHDTKDVGVSAQHIMNVKDFLQGDEYSCTACVLRYAMHRLGMDVPPRHRAILDLCCYPNGATMSQLRRVFKGWGIHSRVISPKNVKKYLNKGHLVVLDDDLTWDDPHVILAYGYADEYINLFDSYTKSGIRRRKTKNAINSATEAFVLEK